jgi:hypothetical protein
MPDFRMWTCEIEIEEAPKIEDEQQSSDLNLMVQAPKIEDEQQPSDLNLMVPDTLPKRT